MTKEQKMCFVIAPIGPLDSPTRKRSDQIFKYVIEPAAKETGYEAKRADHLPNPTLITNEIIQHVLDAPMVVADLTEHNPNVFYELAVRHLVRKPVVLLIEQDQPIPFDVAAMRVIHVDRHDWDSPPRARAELVDQIQALESGKLQVATPISVAIDVKTLQQSGQATDRQLAAVVSAVQNLHADMSAMKASLQVAGVLGATHVGLFGSLPTHYGTTTLLTRGFPAATGPARPTQNRGSAEDDPS